MCRILWRPFKRANRWNSTQKLVRVIIITSGLLTGLKSHEQTTVIVGGGASIICPATPVATWTTPPTGISFSNWARGSGVTCASASNGLSGSAFNTANAAASLSANKYYTVTITADAAHMFILNNVVWNTTVSSGTCFFDVQYRNNGGALTPFGATGQTSLTSNSFSGSVSVAAGTSIVLYFIPSVTGATNTTVRLLNGSSITITASDVSPLPVTLINFSGYRTSVGNQLHWSTTFEQNNAGFEIQRSPDGIDFTPLGFVSSSALNGNSNDMIRYVFMDTFPTASRQFYRLRQVDLDDHSKFSSVLLIQGAKPMALSIEGVYPNPATVVLNLSISSASREQLNLVLTDLSGRIALKKRVLVETGSNLISIDIGSLSNGYYGIQLAEMEKRNTLSARFIKHN